MTYNRVMTEDEDYFCAGCGNSVDLVNKPHCECKNILLKNLMIRPVMLGRTIRYPRNWFLITKDYEYVGVDSPTEFVDLILSPVN